MTHRITPEGIARAALRLNCDAPAIRAVIDVESGGSGFLPDGRPKILFEAHIFGRETRSQFHATHPKLSTPSWTKALYLGGAGEYGRLYQAVQLDGEAAVRSCSWGTFQIMGFNWELCGERSLFGFLLAMHSSADAHLGLFIEFLKNKGLDKALRNHDWRAFAKGFNGASYEKNAYHIKLEAAHRRHGG